MKVYLLVSNGFKPKSVTIRSATYMTEASIADSINQPNDLS
ncbi:hypothetical protein ACLCDV_19070 [Sphingobacterium sp. Lzh-3]